VSENGDQPQISMGDLFLKIGMLVVENDLLRQQLAEKTPLDQIREELAQTEE
jgi:hypothetical protein